MRDLALLSLLLLGAGCLYDGDARCDSDQVLSAAGYCICAAGSVLDGSRCVPCAPGQITVNGRCACPDGKVLREGACVAADEPDAGRATPTGQGMACTAGGGECTGLDADYCEAILLKQCLVRGCSVGGDDCSPGWTCCAIAAAGTTLCLEQARLVQELGSASCPKL